MSNVVEAIDVQVEGTIWRFQMMGGVSYVAIHATHPETVITWDLVESDFFMLVLPDAHSRRTRMAAFFYSDEEGAVSDLTGYCMGNGTLGYETHVPWSLLTRAVARLDKGDQKVDSFGSFTLLADDMVHFRTDCGANYKIERRVLEGLIA